jgi:hypothetical protein
MNALGNLKLRAVRELTTAEIDLVGGGQVYSRPSYPYHQGNTPQIPPSTTPTPNLYTS